MRTGTDATDPELTLRAYDPAADFEGMFGVLWEVVSASPEEARQELLAYPRKDLVAHVATTGAGEVVGHCAATHPYWNAVAIVDYIAVALDRRRAGIGARLMAAVEADLVAARCRRACVQTAAWNTDAVRFYERCGYRRLADLPGYFGDEEARTMVWLDKPLAAG